MLADHTLQKYPEYVDENGNLALFVFESDTELAKEYFHRFHYQTMRHSCPFLHCSVITEDKQRYKGE